MKCNCCCRYGNRRCYTSRVTQREDKPEGRRLNAAGLRRDLRLIEVLGTPEAVAAGGLGVLRVSELVGRDKAVVSRSLATLAEVGLLDRDPATGLYRPGHQLYALAARTFEAELARVGSTALRRAVALLHETTHLCVLRGGSVLTLLSEVSEYNFRGLGWEGVRVPALHTSAGRVLLSDWERSDLERWYERYGRDEPVLQEPATPAGALPVPAVAHGTRRVNDFADLLDELETIRVQGYATVDEEFELGVVGVSAPVRDFRGRIVAALNVSAPKTRMGVHLDQAGKMIAKVASGLSRRIGAGAT